MPNPRRCPYPILALFLLVAGCSDDDAPTAPETGPPSIADVSVAANPHNNLSTMVSFQASRADSVRILYGEPGGDRSATPRYAATGAPQRIAVLGLRPVTLYEHVVEVVSGDDVVTSEPVTLESGDLPDLLANHIEIEITGDPPEGYVVTNIRNGPDERFLILFDETGRIVWYRQFEFLVGFGQQLPNGNLAAFVGSSQGFQPTYGYYEEISPGGEVVRRHQATAPLYTDCHELLLTPRADGHAVHLYSYTLRVVDMTVFDGLPDALIGGHQILRFSPDGVIEFSWNAWDHFSVLDWIELPESRRQAPNADFDHPNSLALDLDGHYIASFRDLAEITKIHAQTGDLIWRFGGVNNEFTILDDPLDGFNGQHSVRVMANGNLLLFDNGLRHDPPESRAVEYALDTDLMTATMVWEYRHAPPVYTAFTGGVERRTNGNTVVQFAATGFMVEVDLQGQVVWTGTVTSAGESVALYRMMPVPSLYEYRVP